MSNYYSLGITGSGQYSPNIFAGEGYGSSRMTRSLNQMINTAIETQMQMVIIQIVSQLLQSIFQPQHENVNASPDQSAGTASGDQTAAHSHH